MKTLYSIFALVMLTGPAWTKESDEAGLLEFIKIDPKAPAPKSAPPPPAMAPVVLLEKWQRYESAQTEKLHGEITAARKIAVEMLTKKAAGNEGLMKEAERIKNLIPEVPLTYTAGRNEKAYQSLIGAWTDADHSEWTPEFLPGGKVVNRDGKTEVWHWIDAEAGVIGSGNGWSSLYYIEKTGVIRTISKKRDRNTLTKVPGQKVPPTDSVILNLHASEVAQRAAFTALTTAQRKRVLDCVIAQAKSLPAEEATELFKDVRRVESTVDERSGRAGMLAGVWKWDSTELSFQSHGVVTGKDGRKIGTWGWVDTGTIDFAVVLKGGKGADDVFIASPPNAGQTSVQVHPMVGKAFTATRSLK